MKYYRLIFISILLLLTACWDVEESDRMDYIHGLGVDYKDGEVIVHLQIVNLGNLGTPDVASEAEQVTIATSSGDTISSAVHDIYQSAQRRLYWGHNTVLILSEAALKHNKLQESIDLMNRFPETRYRINVYATNADVKELLKVSTLFQGTSILTRVTDLENTYEQSSLIQQVSMRELIIQLDEPGYNGILPTIALTEDTWEAEKESIMMIKDIGVANVTATNLRGFILHDDIRGLRWMQESKRNNIVIYKEGKPASEIIVLKPKQIFDIETDGDDVTFHVTIGANAMINEMLQDVNQEFIIKALEKSIKEEVMHTFNRALKQKSDIYRLSEQLYRKKLKVWKKLENDGDIPLDENSLVIDVDIKLVDSKLDKTAPIIE